MCQDGKEGDSANTSEVTTIGNLFYDCDGAGMAKQGDFFTFFNNTPSAP